MPHRMVCITSHIITITNIRTITNISLPLSRLSYFLEFPERWNLLENLENAGFLNMYVGHVSVQDLPGLS